MKRYKIKMKNDVIEEDSIMTLENHILGEINEAEAYHILRRLMAEDNNIKKRAEEIAKDHFSEIDSEDIAESVYSDLNFIDVHDLWDESGSTRYGYVDIDEHAWEMVEDVLDAFVEQMKKYQRLKMYPEAKSVCIGILKGLYRYEKQATNEFADWAVDVPKNFFDTIYDEWEKNQPVKEDVEKVDEFIKNELTEW